MKSIKNSILLIVLGVMFNTQSINAHCEVPCGIYGDSIRVALILEHITTIEKAMTSIIKLKGSDEINYNQVVRWIMNKEEHAEKIQEIVSQYFLHQRIKVVDQSEDVKYQKYLGHLTNLHKILVLSMKTKQSTNLDLIGNLRSAVENFSNSYFHKH